MDGDRDMEWECAECGTRAHVEEIYKNIWEQLASFKRRWKRNHLSNDVLHSTALKNEKKGN